MPYLGHVDDGVVLSLRVELFAAAILDVHHIAGILQNGELHSEADTKEGALLGTSPSDRLNHAGSVTGAESTRHQQAVSSANRMPSLVEFSRVGFRGLLFQMAGVNPDQLEFLVAVHGGVLQGLRHTDVGILESGIFANQGDGHSVVGVILATGKVHPVFPHQLALFDSLSVPCNRRQIQQFTEGANQLLFLKKQRHMVGGRDIVDGNDLLGIHGAHVGDLLNGAFLQRQLAATGNQVRIQTCAANIANGSLGGLRLLLVMNHRDVRHMNLSKVVLARSALELADGVNERRTLNISNSTTQLDNANIGFPPRLVNGNLGHPLDPILNGVGDVGDNLNGLAKVTTDTLALNNLLVNLASLGHREIRC